jgi:sugar lactone lactonase YvrE
VFIQSHPRLRRSASLIALALALAACGGGGGGSAPVAGGGNTGGSAPTPPAAVGPAITAQPVSQTVVAGQAVTFSVAADSTTLSYQWQRDGKDIPGATGLTYTLANPQAADNGSKFTAVATGARGSTTSSAAVLGVSVPKGLVLVAGTPGGPGNLDGTDGEVALPGVLALQPSGALYLVDGEDGFRFAAGLRAIDLATGALTTVERDPALHDVTGIAVDPAGNLYDAPWPAVTAVYRTPPGGKRAVFAGAADQPGSADGPAATARFTGVNGFAMDAAGNLYVNDGGKKIRKVSRDGAVVTLAGGGPGDMADGAGAQAAFRQIGAMAAGRDGSLTVIDDGVLRSVSQTGVVTTRSVVTADGGPLYLAGLSMGVDSAGNAYVLELSYPPRIRRIAPDGTVTTVATLPASGSSGTHYTNLVADAAGNLYVGDDSSQVIRRITPAGVVTDFAGRAVNRSNVDGTGPAARFSLAATRAYDTHYDLATDAQGNVYVGQIDRIRKVTPAGVVATLPLPLGNLTTSYYPASEAIDGSVLAVSNGVISRIDAAGVSHFIAGQAGVTGVADGVGAKATFSSPTRLIVDGAGNIYLTDTVTGSMTDVGVKTYLRKIAPDGTVTTLPDSVAGQLISNCAPDKDGKFWSIDAQRNVLRIGPDGTRTVVRPAADINEGVDRASCDRGGNLFLAMHSGASLYSVHKITPAGTETVIAGNPGTEGVRAGTPGSLGPIDAITVAPDGTVYVMSQEALVRIVQ